MDIMPFEILKLAMYKYISNTIISVYVDK